MPIEDTEFDNMVKQIRIMCQQINDLQNEVSELKLEVAGLQNSAAKLDIRTRGSMMIGCNI